MSWRTRSRRGCHSRWDFLQQARNGSGGADCLRIKGHLDTYRFCDEVWTFLIKDVNFKLDNQSQVHAEKVKIVSCNTKRPGEA